MPIDDKQNIACQTNGKKRFDEFEFVDEYSSFIFHNLKTLHPRAVYNFISYSVIPAEKANDPC